MTTTTDCEHTPLRALCASMFRNALDSALLKLTTRVSADLKVESHHNKGAHQ